MKIEETFNIPPLSEIKEMLGDLDRTSNVVTTNDDAMDNINLWKHNKEMDEISSICIKDYNDLMDIGKDVSPKDGAELIKSATSLIDIALKARISKIDAALRNAHLSIQKNKLQPNKDIVPVDGVILDRNTLLKEISEARKEKS